MTIEKEAIYFTVKTIPFVALAVWGLGSPVRETIGVTALVTLIIYPVSLWFIYVDGR